MHIYYRISSGGYKKNKLVEATKENCFINFYNIFINDTVNFNVIADNLNDDTYNWLLNYKDNKNLHINIEKTELGSSAKSFRYVFNKALELDDNESVYFIEDDYIHYPLSNIILNEGLEIADYITLYDHPDKYIPASNGGNPLIDNDGGEYTKVYLTKNTHWKLTNSTTMTVASKVKTLKDDKDIWLKYTEGDYPYDYDIFIELRKKGKSLISPIPGYSTHAETNWLSPLIDWKNIVLNMK